jgi:hypothetical protein
MEVEAVKLLLFLKWRREGKLLQWWSSWLWLSSLYSERGQSNCIAEPADSKNHSHV